MEAEMLNTCFVGREGFNTDCGDENMGSWCKGGCQAFYNREVCL